MTGLSKLTALLVAALTLSLSGCGTIEGVGKDIKRGGENIQDAARDVQKKL